MLIVAVLPSILFPPKKPVGRSAGPAAGDTGAATAPPTARAAPESLTPPPSLRPSAATPADTAWGTSPLYPPRFPPPGGAPVPPGGGGGGVRTRRCHAAARAGGGVAIGRGRLDGRFPALRRGHQGDEDAAHGLRVAQAGRAQDPGWAVRMGRRQVEVF